MHALVLWQGDILDTYGLIGLVMPPLFLRRSDRTLKIWVVVLLAAGLLIPAITMVSALAAPPAKSTATDT
ncbi:hypothetical protein [Marinitenerispora sediminis]|uniref:hypothetical protein n=1 Tax=Marinitenerispora sediminis TaxID=1931232 RepID=UPI0026BEB144